MQCHRNWESSERLRAAKDCCGKGIENACLRAWKIVAAWNDYFPTMNSRIPMEIWSLRGVFDSTNRRNNRYGKVNWPCSLVFSLGAIYENIFPPWYRKSLHGGQAFLWFVAHQMVGLLSLLGAADLSLSQFGLWSNAKVGMDVDWPIRYKTRSCVYT